MRNFFPGWMLAGVLLAAGCGPAEPPAPVGAQPSRAELQRVEFFGAEVAADPAVAWRPSGLGVKIIAPGDGLSPQLSDRVRLRYTGRLKDGTVFDRSPGDAPVEYALGQMIPGMVTGISALKPGGRAILYVPPSLGYGGLKVGKIPPVSALVFDVELVAVVL